MDYIRYIDAVATVGLVALMPHNAFFNAVFSFLSLPYQSLIIWIAIALIFIMFEEYRNKKFIYYLAAAVAATFVTTFVLKELFMRHRPALTSIMIGFTCPKDYGFPSGHSSVAFAAALVFSVFDKKRSVFYFFIALLIAYSRIYLGCHYFLDVVGGAALGLGISAALFGVKKKLQ